MILALLLQGDVNTTNDTQNGNDINNVSNNNTGSDSQQRGKY